MLFVIGNRIEVSEFISTAITNEERQMIRESSKFHHHQNDPFMITIHLSPL